MITPYPIQFMRVGEDILIRFEEHDVKRLIHMDASSPDDTVSDSLFGYSRGHWQNRTLVVDTERVNAPYFYGDGTPQSDAIRLEEHFSVNDAEARLDYRLIVDDPATFSDQLMFARYWIWKPAVKVQRYDCVE